ncbi:MAG TPA: histidinol-phosphatase [Rectinemataceae bacterium]|nr:histidinol-phosphatase [Rectinemataceae bacterium]
MLFSYHTHTEFCDGTSTAAAMAEAAFEAGYSVLGFSSHAPLPFDCSWTMQWRSIGDYAASVRSLQRLWKPRGLAILLGLEIDYIRNIVSPGDEAYDVIAPDFRLGSVHFLTDLAEDEFTVDEPAADFERHMAGLGGDASIVWKQYYANLVAMIEKGGFDILGHFDLVKKNNARGRWFDEDGTDYRDAAFAAVDRASELGRVAEINTGGLARGKTDSPYPSMAILKHMREAGLRLTLGDDAHAPPHLGRYQAAAIGAAKEAGYTSLWYMDAGGAWGEIGIDEAGRDRPGDNKKRGSRCRPIHIHAIGNKTRS